MYKSNKDFYEKWSIERAQGLKNYTKSQTKNSFLLSLKFYPFALLILTVIQYLQLGFSLQVFVIHAILSCSILVLLPLAARFSSSYSWNKNEKLYEELKTNIDEVKKGYSESN